MNIEAKPAIYLIYCMGNHKSYVGQSKSVKKRIAEHQRLLRLGAHQNYYLQNAYNKYGVNLFAFRVLEYPENTSMENLTAREQYWIDEFNSMDREKGFNLKEAGNAGSPSEETKQKISKANKGKKNPPMSDELRQKVSEFHKGRKRSEETRKKLSEAAILRSQNPEYIKRLSEAQTGKKVSEETRRKISEVQKGKISPKRGVPMSEEQKEKLRGKKHSEETKRKISETKKLKQLNKLKELEETHVN